MDRKYYRLSDGNFSYINDIEEKGDNIIVTTPFFVVNKINENNRFYIKEFITNEVDDYVEGNINHIAGNKAVMEVDHPPETDDLLYFRTSLNNGCARILELWWDGDILMGKYEVSANYPKGADIIGYLKQNVPIGVSVRSMVGYAKPEEYHNYGLDTTDESLEVINAIWILGWDVVLNPGFDEARRVNVTKTNYEVSEDEYNSVIEHCNKRNNRNKHKTSNDESVKFKTSIFFDKPVDEEVDRSEHFNKMLSASIDKYKKG